MSLLDLPKLNSAFKAWFAAQDASVQAEILAHWEATAADPEVQHDGPPEGRLMARATFVVNRCIDRHGFAW